MADRKPIINYHQSGIVYYLTSGDTLCASDFSATNVSAQRIVTNTASINTASVGTANITTANITTGNVTILNAINYFKLGNRYFIATLAEPYAFTVATLNILASDTSGVNATTLGKGSVLYLASFAAPASNIWMKMHTVSTASWLNLTSGNKI